MDELQRKAERVGGGSSSIDVRTLETSQYDHSSVAFAKKSQRYVYSAFLALHVAEAVDAHGFITQPSSCKTHSSKLPALSRPPF